MQVNLLYRPSQTLAQCWLQADESVTADTGAMVGMSTNMELQTRSGGIMSGLKRMFGGESFFRNTFTARGGQGEVLFATPLCGDMAVIDVGARQFFLQNHAYVASSAEVEVSAAPSSVKGMFSGAGFFTLATQGRGQLVLGAFGGLEEVKVDGSMVLDTGHLAAWESSLEYSLGKSGSGWMASWLSGEGLVCNFKGHGSLWVQSRNAQEYGRLMGGKLPPREG